MKPVFQSDIHPIHGNCFAACLASIFEITLEEVPHFIKEYPDIVWWDKFLEWLLAKKRFHALFLPIEQKEQPLLEQDFKPLGWSILLCSTVRNTSHAIVCQDGNIIHNPYPTIIDRDTNPLVLGWVIFFPESTLFTEILK